ncbi:MAG: hypothetical protein ABJF23_24430 [Bryobacteraceae bacterium]
MTHRRLPGKRRTLGGNSTLWLADDHLLLVKSTRFAEQYKRFYFRDIQAFLIREKKYSASRNLWDVFFWLAVVAIYLAHAPLTALFGAALLLYKRFSGPHSVCHIQTAVQVEPLPSLYRLRVAEEVLNQLVPLVEAAQMEESSPSEPQVQQS